MKKPLSFLSLLLINTPVLVTISCNWAKPIPPTESNMFPKNPNYKEPFNIEQNNKKPKTFLYNGITYKLIDEDNVNPTNIYYASQVLENDSQDFKALIPKAEEYKIKNWTSGNYFPTISLLSQFVRNLEHYDIKTRSSLFMLKDKNSNIRINAQEYHKLVSKTLDILKSQKELKEVLYDEKEVISSSKQASIDKIKAFIIGSKIDDPENKMNNLWGKLVPNPKDSFGVGFGYYWEELPFTADGDRLVNIDGNLYNVPTGLWLTNRLFQLGSQFKNELFLSKEFFEKDETRFDPKKQHLHLENAFLEYDYRNKLRVYGMQKSLWDMLIAFLELQVALTDSKNITDSNKTLEENFKKSKILEKILAYEDRLLVFMQLLELFGFTPDLHANPSLQLFPGSKNYPFPVDYRQAYQWAWNEYHHIVQPLSREFTRTGVESKFNNTFYNENKKYYDFIWENIKEVDGVERPYVLDESTAKHRYKNLINYYTRNFGWKYRK
ncbi:MAG3960 family lipoprotein [Mycoplasma feriruminatoris]|uniref:Lipoprotein n=1 Tax=Mycoplasma feriruminatoris TaxID=1179777 RepID=A0A654IMQ6_9MOLU|nr:hypothetical protein [Mycoplasma feriruminatoris]WFQ92678.1 hypothetical protein MFERI14822_00467 [Mycoplasma feriruminatoris]WFQ93867.1 lipoprotein [Mycoplasma feriruminatoris]VZR97380.1 hypothetical protein MF5295_00284 [Mycoplasma feriruminatoris]VZR99883.1 hypothetical protein MF5582_00312 [Mycoplasma feriruminatoris]